MIKKITKFLLVFSLFVGSALSNVVNLYAQETSNEDLALNKDVVASAEYPSMPASNLTDGDEESRWSTEADATQWAYVDLGETMSMNYFSMIWESGSVYAADYNIYVSNDYENWGDAVVSKTGNDSAKSEEKLDSSVEGRYVKLEVTKQNGYPSVSCRDFKIKYKNYDEPEVQDPTENVALNKTAIASSIETDSLAAKKAFDGDTTSRDSRWASAVKNAPHWIYVDLGQIMDIKTIKMFWENRKATKYEIQVADDLSDPMNELDWTTVKLVDDRPAKVNEKIILDEVVKARYVRLYIHSATSEDPDGGVTWNTVSLYEIEVYGGEPKESISDIKEQIVVLQPEKGDKKLQVRFPDTEDYDITYNGTDYEQVIDEDLTIYEPIVETTVQASFKVVDKKTKKYEFIEKPVIVPGTYIKEGSDNASPIVLPELREWKGKSGIFTPTNTSRIVIGDAQLKDMADAFAKDYKEITGKSISIVQSSTAQKGDFFFKLTTNKEKGLKDEGYILDVSDQVTVEAETSTGAFWATRTILHSLKASQNIPKGTARDYPLYKVRGFILDVGRKTFTMDYLEQVVQEMSWYKMNDFQVHLNDNFIPLENYSSQGKDPMDAYSAFRLESDIKKGGNNGLNKADLTSTDVFYTKDEFRDFIKESRVCGVNIVPEIDTPAHSLALTKVRPDLRHGTYGRDNDHLDLTKQYAESLAFVKSVFNEYMGEDVSNPVFDKDTIVHIGADEYNANHEAYRHFADDMLDYTQSSGRTARIWGSLSVSQGKTPVRSEGVQMNLWNFGYANMDAMYDEGFDLINCNDGNYYIVPNAGYYYDYLSNSTLYNLKINSIGGVTIPAGDKQMIGGAFAVWNDMTDYLDNGVSEYDVYDRIQEAIPLFGAKLWGKGSMDLSLASQTKDVLGSAPGTNFDYKVKSEGDDIAHYPMNTLKDATVNKRDLSQGKNASIGEVDGKSTLKLNGKESYVSSEFTTIGLGNDLRVKVKRTSSSLEEQILFESSYGSIKAVQKKTGKVGFSRENMDYSFDYTLPVGEWVELEIKNQHNQAQLYVNGKLVDILGDDEKVEGRPLLATTMIPFERIGSQENSFIGYVDDVRIGKDKKYYSTMDLDYVVWNAKEILKDNNSTELENAIKDAEEIIHKFNPTDLEIKTELDKINALIKEIDFEKADYSRVNAYLNLIPEDLSIYTTSSVKRLNTVVESIRKDLPVSLQDTVDNYEKQLAEALHGLELKEIKNVNYIDNSKLTAQASSYQGGSEPKYVLDDDPNTMWHTDWNITTMPHWIELILDTPESVNGLVYLPRQTGVTNGMVTKYEIQISDDGSNYTKIKEGTLSTATRDEVLLEFDAVTTKYVRLVYLEAGNNNGSAAQLKLCSSNVLADIDGLKSIIKKAEAIKNEGYTTVSWNNLQDKIDESKILVSQTNPDANEVEIMKNELSYAMVSLLLKEKVDTKALDALIKEIGTLDLNLYTSKSVQNLNNILDEVNKIDRENTNQTEIDEAYQKLLVAKNDLVKNSDVNISALKALLDVANNLDLDLYTKESVEVLKQAIKDAETLLLTAPSQDEVDAMVVQLSDAIKGLKIKDAKEVDNEKLLDLIENAKGIDTKKYTDKSVANFEKALKKAKKVADSKNQKEIDEAYNALVDAIANLELKKTTSTDEDKKPGSDSNQGEVLGENVNSSKTDDTTQIAFFVGLLVLAGGTIITKILRKKKEDI